MLAEYLYAGKRMIAKFASGAMQYFLNDRLSERVSLDVSGNVLGRQSHLAFGEDFAESGTQEKHHIASYERDNETQRDYAVNRQFEQGLGRFMRVDPHSPSMKNPLVLGSYGDPQSLNRYNYARNDPINATDPLGLNMCFGYDVFILTFQDGVLIGVTHLGFIPVYCWGDGGGGGSGGGGGGRGVGGEQPTNPKVHPKPKSLGKAQWSEQKFQDCAHQLFDKAVGTARVQDFLDHRGSGQLAVTWDYSMTMKQLGKFLRDNGQDVVGGQVGGYLLKDKSGNSLANTLFFAKDVFPNGVLGGAQDSAAYQYGSAVLFHELSNMMALSFL